VETEIYLASDKTVWNIWLNGIVTGYEPDEWIACKRSTGFKIYSREGVDDLKRKIEEFVIHGPNSSGVIVAEESATGFNPNE
jgi:hypothetical protein